MKASTTVTLSAEIYETLSLYAADDQRRTDLVEAAVTAYLVKPRQRDGARDRQIIDAHAVELNEEAADVLSYQIIE